MNEHLNSRGFQIGGSSDDLFESAARYYAEYRRPYPAVVVNHLVSEFGLDGSGRLLDVGCGTGQVFQVLGRSFAEITAIDPNKEMEASSS
jgi:2-polyprenyl-3-methyl-5-hydroxy-6-metoxy-1,4-benzoquinol methylase